MEQILELLMFNHEVTSTSKIRSKESIERLRCPQTIVTTVYISVTLVFTHSLKN